MKSKPNDSYWLDMYNWFNQMSDSDVGFDRTLTLSVLHYRCQPDGATSGQRAADDLGITRQRVNQLLKRAEKIFLDAHPGTERAEKKPNGKATQLHVFMLEYQSEYGIAPSMRIILEGLRLWNTTGGVQHTIRKLEKEGLVQKRVIGYRSQWWALEICAQCREYPAHYKTPLCKNCLDDAMAGKPSYCGNCEEETPERQLVDGLCPECYLLEVNDE